MKAGRIYFIAYALLVVSVAFVIFLFRSQSLDIEQQNRRLELLLQLKQAEDNLDLDVLRATSFLLVQYDPFVTTVQKMRRIKAQFESPDLDPPLGREPDLPGGVAPYLAVLEQKFALLEHLKSKAALVRNGLHFLPLAERELTALNHELGDQISRLLNELYSYNLLPSELDAPSIERRIDEIEAFAEVSLPERSVFDDAIFHTRANLKLMSEMAELRERYMSVPSTPRFNEVYKALTDFYARESDRWGRLNLILLAATLLLFVALGLALRDLYATRIRAERAWRQLRDAVESLSEAFALFASDGRLVLHNRKYVEFYPWLAESLHPGVMLEDIRHRNVEAGAFVSPISAGEDGPVCRSDQPNEDGRSHMEQLTDGRWFLASDTFTSAGELVCVRVDVTETKRRELELRKLDRALEQSPSTIIITDTDGNIEYVNPKFEAATGYSAAEVLQRNPRLLKSGDKSPEEYKELWNTILSGEVWRGQFHNRHKDGSIYWEAASISPVRDAAGKITHFIAVKEDITARKRTENQLRMNAIVFDRTIEGIMVTDANNHIKTVNPAFTRITGYEAAEVIGRNPSILSSGRHDQAFYDAMWDSLRSKGYWNGEIWNRRKDGSVYPQWLSLTAISNTAEEVREYVAVFTDITRRKQDEEKILHQANFDPLTGLPNRSLLKDRLHHALASARQEGWSAALLFVDLERFKWVNDTLGHAVGDELLQQVAERLGSCVREVDTLARFGGDEFVVLLEDVRTADDAAEVAKKLIAAIEPPFDLASREIFMGASIGVTLYPEDSTDANTLLRNADMAMYRAKQAGHNNYAFFTREMNEQVHQRMALERDLRQAIEQEQLAVNYQPIVDISTGEIVAVEALLCWRHPKYGLVAPDRFIPLAEETGLISSIGRWVLLTACSQVSAWRTEGLRLGISVNLSSRQLPLGLSTAQVGEVLERTGLPPGALTLEITEGLMLEGSESTHRWMDEIKALGVGLAVDDFGTGYSSLGYLKRFPMDSIKIDRSFMVGVPEDPGDASLVEAIVAMARSLELEVVAEGVERREHLSFLKRLGCSRAQGNLFSQPVDAQSIPRLARRVLLPSAAPAPEDLASA
ncbi:MAG: EAL domain-containing protein [Pseudomonadota bacterium]|nr:EAL domain-containing protein [Pseudomonadota bacterium]